MSELGQRRHLARERAIELAYESSMKDRPFSAIVSELVVSPDQYTVSILRSSEEHRDRIEALITENSLDWTLDRLALMDRLIMTLALGELIMDDAPPVAVVLDESVEFAKIFSTEGSASFVNGVLAACVEHLK
ncbi:MAG TPA: transcription antitermination protein NusB [Acidimicrobiales bacterium]|nr:transcription antitermination protein NusB [Acidimicrobiales bacterium]